MHRYASMQELKSELSLEDAFAIFEVLQVKQYTDWLTQVQIKEEAGRG